MMSYIILAGLGLFVMGSLLTLIGMELKKKTNDNS